ncbi:MAG TPA: phosphoglycerate mutase family protein [Phnomibacter sp.]|nr:phosphoglycerate mutase family protein [Phnomibacter sp.]
MKNLVLIFGVLTLVACQTTTKIYIVRHAEKQVQDPLVMMLPNDVELSEAGHARAKVLADTLHKVPLQGIFATTIRRTQQTVEPTANSKGLPVVLYPATPAAAFALVDSLAAVKGKNFLVAGHSNTVPDMIRHLGLTLSFSGNIPDTVYNRFYVITVKRSGEKMVEERTYGAR